MSGDKTQPLDPANMEAMAEAVHEAYLTTCAKLGWDVKPANQVPYSALSEDSKELDRASVRAVLAFAPTLAPQGLPPAGLREAVEAISETWQAFRSAKTPAAYRARGMDHARAMRNLLEGLDMDAGAAERERGGEG